ncbi:MAG: DUF1570 domain-containing protein [Planctomycetota bacterium]|jgi:hypothetical protein|nr:DUF1570 domain-containing protein [Blastopirellula sp.]
MTRLTNRKQKMSGFGLHSRGEFGNLPVWLPRLFVWCLLCWLLPQCSPPGWCDELVIRVGTEAGNRTLNGNVLVEAEDKSLLFQADDGRLWILKAEQIVSRQPADAAVKPIESREQQRRLEEELPGFRFHVTDHFIIAYNTERAYAQWLGGLYEQLYRGFTGYWERKRKFKLDDPSFPLVVVVFASFEEYSAHVRRELGQDPGSMVAYYNLMTNRVTLYDLTTGFQGGGGKPDNDRKIQEILANPNALPMVATVVHEGTHQLMFNMGMQTRLADTPLWVNEGLAMFFETPDLKNPKGWRTIGQVNQLRLLTFRENLPQRAANGESLRRLLTEDLDFRDPKQSLTRYAEAWALNYFLLNRYGKEFVAYLELLRSKQPLRVDPPETRISEFESALGKRLAELDAEFVDYMQKLRD